MNRRFLILVCLVMLPFALPSDDDLLAQDLAELLDQLHAQEEEARIRAFQGIMRSSSAVDRTSPRAQARAVLAAHPHARERITREFICLLERENQRVAPGFSHSDEFAKYRGDLIVAVATLEDERAAEALAGAITTGNGAINGLLALGEAGLQPVLRSVTSSDEVVRQSSAFALGRFADGAANLHLGDESLLSIREALLVSVTDESPVVRLASARALQAFSDEQVRDVMLELVESDPYSRAWDATSFPVREMARIWLERHGS